MGERMIKIDDEVFAELQRMAEPLVDDANAVLRRVLNLPADGRGPQRMNPHQIEPATAPNTGVASPANGERRSSTRPRTGKQAAPKRRKRSERAPKGSLLPESEYELPLLEALVELDGSAPTSAVVDRLGKKLETRLTEGDRETISSGEIRWRNRVQFVRLGLIKEGLMLKDSPRGVWEITDQGRERVAQNGSLS